MSKNPPKMKDYRKLLFWVKSHQFAKEVYEETKGFPKSELYGLTSQLRRAAVSIPTNIVEGCGRESKAELKRYLVIASGSAAEVEYLLFFASEIGLIQKEKYNNLNAKVLEIKKTLTSYKNKI